MIRAMRRMLGGTVAGLLACAGLAGLVVGPGQPTAAALRNTGLSISPVFTTTLVGDFDQAGNTLFDCKSLTDGSKLPIGGCQRDVLQALATGGPAFYNNQVIQQYLDRDANSGTRASSSATVTVPTGAQVVFAELSWLGTTQKDTNPQLQWDPNIWMSPMKMSVGDDQHYVSITPDEGTSIAPGSPASDTNDFYYSASAKVTQYLLGRTGQITVWGADAPFPANGFNQAGLGWNIVVVYRYPSVDLTASPPHVGKLITVQTGFAYQQSGKPATNTTVTVPAVSDPDHVHVGLIAGEGDTGLTGDTFSINGHNIAHPVTGQTNNFFVSYAQNATSPNWTSNFSTDNVSWTLASGIVHAGDTSVVLTTTTNGDGYFLAGANTAIPVPSIGLTKTVASTYTTVNAPLTYTFTVTNTSAVTIHGLSVTDPLFGGTISACNHPGDLAGGASYQCTATHTVTQADIAAGHIDNTATAHGVGEANEALTAQASATTTTSTSLSITKVGNPKPVHVGDPFTYTITVTNIGPADAANVTVTDPLPAGLAGPTVTTGNATITGGVLHATIPLLSHIAPNNTFTITVSGTIASSFTGTSITNTATVAAPNTICVAGSTDPECAATDITQVLQPAPITITKVTSNSTPKPGETFTYTVQVRNVSTTTTATAMFSDTIPANLIGASWTCAASTGSTCGTSTGTGNITGVALTLLPLGVATFTIAVRVDPAFQGGTITNTATAAPGDFTFCEANPTAATCSVAVPVTVTPNPALLTITKTHTPNNPSPGAGQPITYRVTVTNTSTSTIAHATLDDPVPAQITPDGGWTSATTGAGTTATPSSAATGFPSGVTLVIAPGGTVTFTITAHVSATYDGTQVTNVATATPGTNTGCADVRPTCQAQDSFANPARLTVTKTHTPTSPDPVPGQQVTYTVTVTNPGNSATASGTFSDPLPDPPLDAAAASWTCAPSPGSTCGQPTGTGSPSLVAITVAPNGGTVTFTITVTIRASAAPVRVHNVGSVTPNPGTACVDGQPTCDGQDTFEATPELAPLTIAKSQDPPTPAQAGAFTYTVVVTNTSAFTTAHATFDDPVPAQITPDGGWTTTTTGAGSTATPSSAATGFPTGVTLVIAPGGTVTFTITGHVSATYNGTEVTNTATASPGLNTGCEDGQPTCQAEVSFANPAQLTVAKTHTPANPDPVPGQQFTYTVTITNPGNSATASGAFSDPLPDPPLDAAGATWTCAASTGSTCGQPTGTGSPTDVPITVARNGGTVTFTIAVTIRASEAPVTVHNVGSVTPNPGTVCVDGQPTCDGHDTFTATPEPALLTIAKSHTPVNPTPPAAGELLTYTVVVTNTSAFTTAHATLDDPVPAEIVADGGWTTTTTGAGTTATPSSAATGFPTGITLVIAPGGTVTFTITGHVSATYNGTQVTNTATATPGLNTDCADGQPTCQAEDSFINPARLEVAKTHAPTDPHPVPGQQFTYTVTITNPGNSATASGAFSDPLPDPPLDAAGATWTCAASTGSSCGQPTGTGSPTGVAITVAPNGGTVTFTITVTIRASEAPVTVHNVGSVTPGAGTECVDGQPTCDGDNTFTATPETALLTIAKSQDPTTPAQGGAITYTVVVTNTSTFTTAHATFDDPVPAQITPDGTWSSATTATGTTVTPPGPAAGFPTGVTLVIAPGGTVTFTITADVSATYNGTQVTNTATATPGTNTDCADGQPTCQAAVSFANPARLTVAKTHTPTNPDPVPGQQFTYAVTVTNPGNSATGSGTFSDPLPDPPLDAAGATWTCDPSPGSTCGQPTGTGSPTGVPITVAPNGGTVTFTITVTIRASEAPVTVHNVGSVTPNPGTECTNGRPTCDGEDSFEATPELAPLTIAKSQDPTTPGQGGAITYTVVVTNTSEFTTAHATFDDPVPAQIVADGGWTTTTTGAGTTATPPSATIGFPSGVDLSIAPLGTVTFTITAHVADPYDGTEVTNTATASPGLNTACEDGRPTCQAEVSFTNPARLTVTKTHTPTNPDPVAGQQVTYTVTVTNPGSSATGSGTFSDPLPPQLDAATATWTCTASTGSTCGQPTGTGSPTGVPITVAPDGGTVSFTITATILQSGVPVTVRNVASVTPGDGTECTDGQPTCDGEDTFTADETPATLTIAKTHEPAAPTQGQAFTYTVTVTNTSTTTVANGTVNDPFDSSALTGITWTATSTAGSTVTPTSGSGSIAGVQVTLAPGGVVSFTVHATVRSDWPGGDVINTSVVTPGDQTECDPTADPSCSATDDFPTPSLIKIVKTHEPTNPLPQPGQHVTYRVTVTNLSDQQGAVAAFDDPLPPQLNGAAATWTTETTGTGTTVSPAQGTGSPAGVALTLGPGGTVTFVITAQILPTFQGGTITNLATATPGENTACDPEVCDATTSFDPPIPSAPLAITKSVTPSGPLAPGDNLTYTVTVSNAATTTTGHGTITDPVPAGLTPGGSWTATATAGSTVTPTSGSGPIDAQVTVAPGGHVTFIRAGQVDPNFNADFDIDNVATLTPGANTHCDPTDPTQACDANAVVHVNVPPEAVPVSPPSPIAPASLPVTG